MAMATVTPPWAYTLQLPQDPRGPGIARATLRTVLAVHGMRDLIETAELLAGELVTNAYRHSSAPYSLRLRGAGRNRVRVGVWDSNPVIPEPFGGVPEEPCALAERGRGLQIVRECAKSWGAYPIRGGLPGQGGKVLWVECAGKPDCQWSDLT
ncbi:MAG TPA: ATP-binding protein [Streptomyces sp.]|uniref:ATP-binding protein n=1 Tax=Streptomyces sp. TaxID=1931 RepID=UPI002BB2996C|nr:ATP-binding protein [Streptomyces sp.]HWU12343.1 ATP-binding protein [Streptomyces sp.]